MGAPDGSSCEAVNDYSTPIAFAGNTGSRPGASKTSQPPSGLDFAGVAEHYYLVCNSLVNELHQNLVLERFCKEAKSSRIECGLAH